MTKVWIAGATFLFGISTAATAAPTIIFEGTVVGTDAAGLFGNDGGVLNGAIEVAFIAIDGISTGPFFLSGNINYQHASVSITYNQISYVLPALADEPLKFMTVGTAASGSPVYFGGYATDAGEQIYLSGQYDINGNLYSGPYDFNLGTELDPLTTGKISLTEVSSNFLPSVPDCKTWTLFISGFGLVGTMMRRKKATVSFA